LEPPPVRNSVCKLRAQALTLRGRARRGFAARRRRRRAPQTRIRAVAGQSFQHLQGGSFVSSEPLRICLLTYRGNPRSGGQGIYIRLLSRALVDLGHRVDVWSGQPYPELLPGVGFTEVPSLDL